MICLSVAILGHIISKFQSEIVSCIIIFLKLNYLEWSTMDDGLMGMCHLLFSFYSVFHYPVCTLYVLVSTLLMSHDDSVDSHAVAEMDEDVKMATLVDPINAYSFLYPVELPGKKFTFKWYCNLKNSLFSPRG